MSFYIESYNFKKPVANEAGKFLSEDIMGTNWPVVYILHGNKEVYVGETSDADSRMNQHLDPNGANYDKRKKLDKVEIIFDTTYNKSAILDIEQSLIRLFKYEINVSDDKKKSRFFKKIQNQNNGQSRQHNYYQRAHYLQEVEIIWENLRELNIATNSYQEIVNDAVFKFSPYSTLTQEQSKICLEILENIMDSLESTNEDTHKGYSAIVKGSAGTGKTIVLMHMMSFITQAIYSNQNPISEVIDDELDDEDQAISLATLNRANLLKKRIQTYVQKHGKLKIAYVAQMTSLRNTVGNVLKGIDHLYKKSSKGPNDIANEYLLTNRKFDIVFVDEGHRLWQRKKIQNMGQYDIVCRKMYGADIDPNTKTTLDWLMDSSKTQVIVYDDKQTVKSSDITNDQFNNAISRQNNLVQQFTLKQQMRCSGGERYIAYLNDILDGREGLTKKDITDYDFRLYSDANRLIDDIITANNSYGLCKVVAGSGWQWNTKKYEAAEKGFKKAVASGTVHNTRAAKVKYYVDNLSEADGLIRFGDKKYVRNLDFNWIIDGDPREIGCIHTSQGYDLNYVGILFGPEIDHIEGEGIVIYEDKIRDSSLGASLGRLRGEELTDKKKLVRDYVLNAYKVMMERGIKGCYVYAFNNGLQKYLKQFIGLALLTPIVFFNCSVNRQVTTN